jgi:hypothetical protein
MMPQARRKVANRGWLSDKDKGDHDDFDPLRSYCVTAFAGSQFWSTVKNCRDDSIIRNR